VDTAKANPNTAKANLNTASQEDTVAEELGSTHPNTASQEDMVAEGMTSTHLSTMSKEGTEELGSTQPNKETMVNRLDMADQAMDLHQTLLRASTVTTRHTAALEITTIISTISMVVHHNIRGLHNTSRVTEGLLSMVKATVEHRSLAGNSMLEL
jgi:hypothetical protein